MLLIIFVYYIRIFDIRNPKKRSDLSLQNFEIAISDLWCGASTTVGREKVLWRRSLLSCSSRHERLRRRYMSGPSCSGVASTYWWVTGFDSGDHTFLYRWWSVGFGWSVFFLVAISPVLNWSLFGSLIHGYGFNLGFGGLEAGEDLE